MAKKVKKTALELKTEVSKSAEENGERRIRFVATSVNQDRHYEKVDVDSLRLPLKRGGEIRAGAIPAEGVHDLVDIPLILNHSANVLDTIGSVRSAFYENGELIFEAGISSRKFAQEMLTLLEEGHLSNAFSITMSDYDYNFESETISNAEIIEVSLVFRGANREARLLAVKSLKGEEMKVEKRASGDNYGDNPENVQVERSGAEETPKTSDDKKDNKEEREEEVKKHVEVATDEIKKAVPSAIEGRSANNYLKSDESIADFANILLKNAGGEAKDVKKDWEDHLKSKGVSNPEVLLPGALVESIKDTIEKGGKIFNVINKTGLTVYRANVDTGTDRAKGHNGKGADKKETNITLVDRVLRAQYIYQYLTLNKEDVRENQDTGALIKFVVQTLPKRIINEIERAIVLGDGRSSDGDEITSFISIKADAKANNSFATKYTPESEEALYDSIVRAAADIQAEGDLYLVMSKKSKADLRLARDKNGSLVLPVGTDLNSTLEVKEIFTPSWFNSTNETEYAAFLFVGEAYATVGDSSIESFTNFALKQNKLEYLQEIYAGGGLIEPKSAVGIAKAG